jgi:hypothetical protein
LVSQVFEISRRGSDFHFERVSAPATEHSGGALLTFRRRAVLSVLLQTLPFTALPIVACNVFEPPPAGSEDGGGGSGGVDPGGKWWPYRDSRGCDRAGVPGPGDAPKTEDSTESGQPLYLALSRYRLSSQNDAKFTPDEPDNLAWAEIGLDFDNACKNSDTCKVNGKNVIDQLCEQSTVKDGSQCRDNTIGRLFISASVSTPGKWFGVREDDFNCAIRRGRMGIIFKISDYNGGQNDKQVRVDLYTSTGLVNPINDSGSRCRRDPNTGAETIEGTLPDDWPSVALWRSNERWRVTQQSLAQTDDEPAADELPNAKAFDPRAYVRNGYLVAHLTPGGIDWWLNGKNAVTPGFRLVVQRALLVGKISQDSGEWRLTDAIITGVTSAEQMVQSFREIGFCDNMCDLYRVMASFMNINKDAMLGTNDKQPARVRCDGLTWAGDIEARAATALKSDIDRDPAPYPPLDCPQPRHSAAPRQGQRCEEEDGGLKSDAGGDAG